MGRVNALGMAEAVRDGTTTLTVALGWHLSANHYPPVPLTMMDPCLLAIRLANEGNYDDVIQHPPGITRRGRDSSTVAEIIEGFHLDPFLAPDDTGETTPCVECGEYDCGGDCIFDEDEDHDPREYEPDPRD